MEFWQRFGSGMKTGIAVTAISAIILAGCGGGGGGDNGGNIPAPVTLSGTAASGLPMASATVDIKDKNGATASATTLADGTYSADVTDMTAPYLIKVGGLYSVATAAGTANVHPFTDMIVRNWYRVHGSNVDTAFNTAGAMATPPTAAEIDTIEGVVRQILATYMRGANVNPSGFNLIKTPFSANHAGFDLVLDNLKVTQPTTLGGNVTIGLAGGGTTGTILTVAENTPLDTITPPAVPVSDTVAPTTPGGMTASRTSAAQVVLSWGVSTDTQLAGYKIYRSGTQVGITDQPFYIDGAATNGVSDCYTVSAYDAAGNSSGQNTQVCAPAATVAADVTAPAAPGSLIAVASSSSQINLAWSASSSGDVAGYRVMVGGAAIATLPNTATAYNHKGLNGNTQYSYTVVAIDTSGNATSSTVASATTLVQTDTTAPTVPSGVTATAVSSGRINLAWTASTDAAGVDHYKVYSGATLVGSSATTSYSAINLAAATQYCYTVEAYDAAGNASAPSAQACATTQASALVQRIKGTWWDNEHNDGLRQDGTWDDYANEVDAPVTIAVGADGSWTYSFTDRAPNGSLVPASVNFPASAVTIDEATSTVTLMGADGLGRILLKYDAASKSILGQWQPYNGTTWLANYETWTMTGLIADTWIAAWGDGTTYTFKADGTYTGWVNCAGCGYEQGTYTWNPATHAFVGNDLTHNSLNQTATVTVSGNTLTHTDASGTHIFNRAAEPTGGIGSWYSPGTDGTNLVYTFFANGDYMQAQSVVPAGTPGLEHGSSTFDRASAYTIKCPTIDTNLGAGFSSASGSPCIQGSITMSGSMTITGNTMTVTPSTGGTMMFTRVIDANPIVGTWSGPDTHLAITFFANGDYMLAQSITTGPFVQPGIEHGTYTWNPSTGAFTASCPTVDTNLQAGFSAPTGVQCTSGIVMNGTATVSGNVLILDGMTFQRVTQPTQLVASNTFTTFALPAGSRPFGFVAGVDGNLWYTDAGTNSIGKMTPAGVVTTYAIPTPNSCPQTIINGGHKGEMWFVEGCGNKIAAIDPATGGFYEVANTPGGWPQDLALGSDGNIWFTDQGVHGGGDPAANADGAIGKLNIVTGAITKYSLLTPSNPANFITLGPDGAMWFTQSGSAGVARIDMAGSITEFPNTGGALITTGSDGNLWVGAPIQGAGAIGKLTTAGVETLISVPSGSLLSPFAITAAPDGNLWFSETNGLWPGWGGGGKLGRITTGGAVTEFTLPASNETNTTEPSMGVVTVGPDGAIWFTDPRSARIVRFQP